MPMGIALLMAVVAEVPGCEVALRPSDPWIAGVGVLMLTLVLGLNRRRMLLLRRSARAMRRALSVMTPRR